MPGNKALYSDDFDDGMDDPMYTQPTETYTDEYYEEEEEAPPTGAAIKFTVASEEAKKREQAAEARKTQKAAEARREGDEAQRRADAAVWLAARGFSTEGFTAAAVISLFDQLKNNEACTNAEFDDISRTVPEARVHRENRRVLVAGSRFFFSVAVSWTYPSSGDSIQVDSNDPQERTRTAFILANSKLKNTAGFLTKLVRVLARAASGKTATDVDGGAADEAPVDTLRLWAAEADESFGDVAQKKLSVIVAPVERPAYVPPSAAQLERVNAARLRAIEAQRRRLERNAPPPQDYASFSDACLAAARRCGAFPYHAYAQPDYTEDGPHAGMEAGRAGTDCLDKMAVAAADHRTGFVFTRQPLRTLPGTISLLTHLEAMDLSGCRLSTLPPLGDLRLQKLYLANNRFEIVPDTIMTAPRTTTLRILDMSSNRVDRLPEAMARMKNLEIVIFEYNRLKSLCDMAAWQKLEVLELTDNNIRRVPPVVATFPRLWRLRLGANPLENLTPEIYFQGLEKIKEYLTEVTPTSLPVPPKTLAADIARCSSSFTSSHDGNSGGCDVRLFVQGTEKSALIGSFMLHARLPGLFSGSAASGVVVRECAAPAEEDGRAATTSGVTHEVGMPDAMADETFDALVRLLHCQLSRETVAGSAQLQVELGSVVSAYGSQSLNAQLGQVLRGHAQDADEVLGAELESVAAAISASAMAQAQSTPLIEVGDLVSFAVGPRALRFTVHRRLLAARIGYFANMFASGLEEAAARVIPLEDTEPEVFASFVEYVYTDSSSKLAPDNVVSLLYLAVEYDVPRLRGLAEAMIGFNVDVENVAQVIQLAYFLDSDRLKNACMYFVSNNYAAVRATEAFHLLQDEVKAQLAAKLAQWGKARS